MKQHIIVLSLLLFLSCLQAMPQPKLTRNNIDKIIAAMTLDEKNSIIIGGANAAVVDGVASGLVNEVPGAAGKTRPVLRLGIPNLLLADGPAGLRISPTREGDNQTYYCTAYPIGTLLASSWDVNLVQHVTSAMGNEVKEYGVDVLLAPGANIQRNPLCGRNFEYFSEDPFLSGNIAAAYINGLQQNGIGACLKHFAVNNQETNRVNNNSIVGSRALREIYLKNFEIAIHKSNPWTIMASYNRLNGPYTQQSNDLLTKVLRQDWGYNGVVMTDWGRKPETYKSVLAGVDLYEPGTNSEFKRLQNAVANGTLPEAAIDSCVKHILQLVVKTPHFKKYKYSSHPDLKAHAEIARKAAAESMILLRNENSTLPLQNHKKIALYGLGGVDMIVGGTGSGSVNKAYSVCFAEGLQNAGYTVDDTLLTYYRNYIESSNASSSMEGPKAAWGAKILKDPAVSKDAIKRQAQYDDVAIIVIRRSAGEGADRKLTDDFELTDNERQLIHDVAHAYHQFDKKVIVVLNVPGAIETASWKQLADAIVLPWAPGQEGGNAFADVISGKVNPSGKLPMTLPVDYYDMLSSRNFPLDETTGEKQQDFNEVVAGVMGLDLPKKEKKDIDYTEYKEGIWVGYRYFDKAHKTPSYPFGYGLSYTDFLYTKPSVKADKDGITASITVKNTGKKAGKEVVELYIAAPNGGLTKPVKELKAFAKTRELKPGESQTLQMKVSAYDLASFNSEKNEWETAGGQYVAFWGASISDIRQQANFFVDKPQTWKVSDAFVNVKVNEFSVK